MNLKNYTSQVPMVRSIDRIEKLLMEMDSTHITKRFEKGACVGIFFQIRVDGIFIPFQLPANIEEVEAYLMKDNKRMTAGMRDRIAAQAHRTAWKTIAEWVEIQITMILMKQAKPLQVFLPYVYDPGNDNTFYDRVEASGLKLLTNRK